MVGQKRSADDQPWYLRLIETQGIGTFMALVLLIGGYKLADALVSKVVEYMSLQIRQTEVLTQSVQENAKANVRQEELLRSILTEMSKDSKNE